MAESDDPATGDVALRLLKRWYHVPVVAVLMLFMFWTRFQNWDAFTRDGNGIWLQAVDSWYHWRATNWMVDNFPQILSFDPWTGFPEGRAPGQFGTLFDQIVATVAMGIGLGSPTQNDVLLAVLITVPAIGALVAVPVYGIGKRLGSRFGGIAGVAVLALFTGEFFNRATAGQFDHHIVEALFMGMAVLATIVALTVAERERPVWELVTARDWVALRRPIGYSILAGVAMTLYIWVWPPGIVIVGIAGLYFILQLSIDQARGRPPDHIAFVGVVSMVVVAAGTAARIQQPGFGATSLDFFQPTLALLVAAGCVFMAGLARVWDGNDLDRRAYPLAVGASVLGGLVAVALVLPGVFDTLTSNLSGRLVPIGHSASSLTVAEVDPPNSFFTDFVQDEYGLAFYTALVSLPVLLVQSVLRPKERARYLFVLVWGLVLLSMGMTQVRFNYYLAVAVAVLNAHLVGLFTAGIELPVAVDELGEGVTDVQAYQVFGVVLVLLVALVPMVPPVADATPLGAGDETGPHPDAVSWEESNEWLAENTPVPGDYGGANNADQLGYSDRYGYPAGGLFDYPNGTYGVMSWWDFGHLITTQANRIPHANPFQQNARSASAFLTAQNESQAELFLDAIAAGQNPTHESNRSALQEAVAESGEEPGIQYVMINDRMATDIFGAIAEWTGPDYREYITEETRRFPEGQGENRTVNEQEVPVGGDYDNTTIARLYLEDAEAMEHYRLVHESSVYSIVGFFGARQSSQPIGNWSRVSDAGLDSNFERARAGNFGVPIGGPGQYIHDPYATARVKTFERVEGATLTGETGFPNGTVRATVDLRTSNNRTFTYEQTATPDSGGAFELTVPYPTDETLQPEEGYANASVRATTAYNVTVVDDPPTPAEEVQGIAPEVFEENLAVSVPEDAVQAGESLAVDLTEPAQGNLSALDIAGDGENASVTAGTDQSVTVDVENGGEKSDSFETTLTVENSTGDVSFERNDSTAELAGGETETLTFENVTDQLEPGVYDVTVATADDELTGELTVQADVEPPESNLSALDIATQGVEASITAGDNETVAVTIENLGEAFGRFNATLSVGEAIERTIRTPQLSGTENRTETLTYENVTGELGPGTYDVTVATADDSVAGTLVVEEPGPAAALSLNVAGTGPNGTVEAGVEEGVEVLAENTGDAPGVFEVSLAVGESVERTTSTAEVAAGETDAVTFENVTGGLEPGEYEVAASTAGAVAGGSLTVVGGS